MRELGINGQGEGDAPEQGGGSGSLPICLCLLAALGLAVMMVVTQLPVTAPALDHVVQHSLQTGPVYLVQEGSAGYAFQSCTGGDSVNCHINDNIAGL